MKRNSAGDQKAGTNTHVCPWWLAYTFDNPIRRWIHRPRTLLAPFVKEGMHVIDIGCGMGVFTIAMAELVGNSGSVTALDVQEKMLEIAMKRARKAGIDHRIQPVQGSAEQIAGRAHIDFALAFWMIHEVPDRFGFFRKIATALKPDGVLLAAEPAMHVSRKDFDQTLMAAASAGLLPLARQPEVRFSLSKVLGKQQE